MGRLYDLNSDERYGEISELKEKLLYKRIVEWDKDKLVLDDGTIVTLETSEWDCCAGAYGEFSNVELDAAITDIVIGEQVDIPDDDTIVSQVELKIFHNRNVIAEAEMTADAGNGGYYYSVGSVVIDKVHFPIVDA